MEIDYSLYLITDRGLARGRSIEALVRAAIRGGITCIQVREKRLPGKEFLHACKSLKATAKASQVPFIVNDRIDVALAAGADGVHIGQDDLPLGAARAILGKKFIIGVSAETPEEAREAESGGADYIGAGPLFATGTKHDAGKPIGIHGLQKILDVVSIPVVAIGGITRENAGEIIRSGAAGVAVISAILSADDPERAAQALAQAIKEARR